MESNLVWRKASGREGSHVPEDFVSQTSMTSIFNSSIQDSMLDCCQKERKSLLK